MFEITQRREVALLQMVHGKANTMDVEFCQGLAEQLEGLKKSSSKALVLTGRGNIFSAGLDLVRVLNEGSTYLRDLVPALSTVFEALFFFPKPVVAAVNGHAIAGGCLLASAADHRIMAQGTGCMGVPELLVGVPFPTIALEIMRFATNSQRIQTLMYGGATYPPNEAVGLGLIDEIVEPSDLLEVALEKAERLAGISPRVFELTKRQIRQPVLERARDTEATFEPSVRELWGDPETLEAMRSYVSRTLKKK